MYNILANVNGFRICYIMFKTTSAVRYPQN